MCRLDFALIFALALPAVAGDKAALRQGDWKLLRNPARGQDADWQLFNLAEDIGETGNLASANPEKLQQLLGAWESLNAEMQEPFWTPSR